MAIAHDADGAGAFNVAGVSSLTWSHTCTGSNLILWVTANTDNTLAPTAKYNGVAMTEATHEDGIGATGRVTLFYLLNPSTGANTVEVDITGPHLFSGNSTSYTGVKQSGQPDATNVGNDTSGAADHLAVAVTSVADNCWAIYATVASSTQSGFTYTNVTKRSENVGMTLSDTNGVITPAGSLTATVTASGVGQSWVGAIASFAPVVTITPIPPGLNGALNYDFSSRPIPRLALYPNEMRWFGGNLSESTLAPPAAGLYFATAFPCETDHAIPTRPRWGLSVLNPDPVNLGPGILATPNPVPPANYGMDLPQTTRLSSRAFQFYYVFDTGIVVPPVPFVPIDTSLSTFSRPNVDRLSQLLPLGPLLGGVVAGQSPSFDTPLPIGRTFPIYLRSSFINNLSQTLTLPAPFFETEFPLPKGRLYPEQLRSFLVALNQLLTGQDVLFGAPGQALAVLNTQPPKGQPYPDSLRSSFAQRFIASLMFNPWVIGFGYNVEIITSNPSPVML